MFKKLMTSFKICFPTKIGALGYVMFFLQFYYLYQVAVYNDLGGFSFTFGTFFLIFLSMVTVLLFYLVISSIFSFNRIALITSNLLFIVCFGLLVSYHFGARELLEWSVLVDNFAGLFSKEAVNVVFNSLDVGGLFYIIAFVILFGCLEFFRKTLSRAKQERPLWPKVIIGLVVYGVIIFSPISSYDPFILFFRSVYHHYHSRVSIQVSIPKGTYPLLNNGQTFHYTHFKSQQKPYVFLIIMESLNASVIGKTDANGLAYTPYLNYLQSQGIYVEHFYGNSVLTPKGHFAILCSIIPSISGKVFTKYDQLEVESIATVLQKAGYTTTFFSAHRNLDFDNTYGFLSKHGFQTLTTAEPYLTDEDKKNASLWGVEDSVFFKRFFVYFDQLQKTSPHFITITTIANHFPFEIAKNRPSPFTFEANKSALAWIRQNYLNSIHLSDQGIQVFFEELKKRGLAHNSIVIITGDHAFPLGEHGNYHLEAGYHEESFRTPLFLVWDGTIKPEMIATPAYSQMDIAPTLVDLLNIKIATNNFQGQSLFNRERQEPIYLIQPYGKHISIINYPLKYRFYDKTQQEYVYDLSQDPMEMHNIISKISMEQKRFFREKLKHVYLNQFAIMKNRFW